MNEPNPPRHKAENWFDLFNRWEADRCTEFTGFRQFNSRHGIDGLAQVCGDCLQLLAVFAETEGKGQFHAFMTHAKELFPRIEVWEVWSKKLAAILPHYGFQLFKRTLDTGEEIVGWLWEEKP